METPSEDSVPLITHIKQEESTDYLHPHLLITNIKHEESTDDFLPLLTDIKQEEGTGPDCLKTENNDLLVTLDTYNSDLNLIIDSNKYGAHPLSSDGFSFLCAGVRATHGMTTGKCCFEVKIVKCLDMESMMGNQPRLHLKLLENPTYSFRVGFSTDSPSLQLGEVPNSFGFMNTAKSCSCNCFTDFGHPFGEGDVVTAFLDIDEITVNIGFSLNGVFLGWSHSFNKDMLRGKALFPHILTRNTSFKINFGQCKPFLLHPTLQQFRFIDHVPSEFKVLCSRPPASKEECEVVVVCGLPGAGKTFWANKLYRNKLEKKYYVLGSDNILANMKMSMKIYNKREGYRMMKTATRCFDYLLEIASNLQRNYIIDYAHSLGILKTTMSRLNFDGFRKTAMVVVPSEGQYARHYHKHFKSKYISHVTFELPEVGEFFSKVVFAELQRDEAEVLVKKFKAGTLPF